MLAEIIPSSLHCRILQMLPHSNMTVVLSAFHTLMKRKVGCDKKMASSSNLLLWVFLRPEILGRIDGSQAINCNLCNWKFSIFRINRILTSSYLHKEPTFTNIFHKIVSEISQVKQIE